MQRPTVGATTYSVRALRVGFRRFVAKPVHLNVIRNLWQHCALKDPRIAALEALAAEMGASNRAPAREPSRETAPEPRSGPWSSGAPSRPKATRETRSRIPRAGGKSSGPWS